MGPFFCSLSRPVARVSEELITYIEYKRLKTNTMSFKVKPGKTLNCSSCSTPVEHVGHDADGVICWRCVSAELGARPLDEEESVPRVSDQDCEK